MKFSSAIPFFLLAVAASAAIPSPADTPALPVPRTPDALIKAAVEAGEAVWADAQDPAGHNIRMATPLTYALALCEAKQHPERLERLFDIQRKLQDRDPQSPTYGSFRWQWNDTTVKDANAIEFSMQPAAVLWLKHRDSMPAAARTVLHDILEPAAVIASLRHRVSDGYTNIAVMSASNLIMLGEDLGRPDVADEGYKRLQAVFDLTLKTGIREYVSPDYYGVDLDALQLAATFAQRPAGRRQAQALVELFWTDVAAHFWWPNRRLAGAHGRNYDYLHGTGGLDRHLWAVGWIGGERGDSAALVFSALAQWPLPAALVDMSREKLPRLVRQMWGGALPGGATPGAPAAPSTANGGVWAAVTHWLGRDVTLSVGGKNYGPIDIPLAVDFPGPRDSVRCFFLPDGRGDPYGKSKIPWRGHPKAVHLQPFFAAVQETRDALALVVYRDEDIPEESTSLASHFVMPRDVDAIYVGEQRILFAPGTPRTIALEPGAAVFLRKGTAALAVRVPAARTLADAPAPVALVWDDNEWGAIRVTVDHRKDNDKPKVAPAAAWQVRVGSELNEAAFADFRRVFAAAKCDVSFQPGSISLRSPAEQSPLVITAATPWKQPTRLAPAPPAVVLEIDGQDVGRRLLEAAKGSGQ
jgi:hypothetical protein